MNTTTQLSGWEAYAESEEWLINELGGSELISDAVNEAPTILILQICEALRAKDFEIQRLKENLKPAISVGRVATGQMRRSASLGFDHRQIQDLNYVADKVDSTLNGCEKILTGDKDNG